jgi:hypothetical protein
LKGVPDQLVAAVLGYEWGIGVRSGCFCAQPYVSSLLEIDKAGQNLNRYRALHQRRDLMHGLVRISLGLYNTQDDIDSLVVALHAIVRGEFGKYCVDRRSGIYQPADEVESFDSYFKMESGSTLKSSRHRQASIQTRHRHQP